jgi:protein-disulfide isomerase
VPGTGTPLRAVPLLGRTRGRIFARAAGARPARILFERKEMSVAAERRQKRGSGSNQLQLFFVLFGIVAAVGVAWLIYTMVAGGRVATEPVPVEGLDNAQVLLERAQGVGLGDPAAPVRILEFADYQCPTCAVFALQTKPRLEEQFIRQGQVYLVYYDFPLGSFPHSFLIARAARCAGDQEMFWQYQTAVYAEQSRFANRPNIVSDLVRIGREVGLDGAGFESCVRSDRHADVVTANRVLGERLGVGGTPTVIVGGRMVPSPWDYNQLRGAVEAELQAMQERGAVE